MTAVTRLSLTDFRNYRDARLDAAKGFVVVAKRWIVERTFGCLGRCRRLGNDFENLTRTQLAFVQLAMIRLMTRRIARLCQSS